MMDAMRAEFEIRQLHARYSDAVYRKDLDALPALFAEDAEWRVGGQTRKGIDEIVGLMRGVFPQFQRIVMIFASPIVEVTENEVLSRAFANEQSRKADGSPFSAVGIYYDRFIEQNGHLVFKWRMFQTQYSGPPVLVNEFEQVEDYGAPPAMPPLDAATVDSSGVGSKAAAS